MKRLLVIPALAVAAAVASPVLAGRTAPAPTTYPATSLNVRNAVAILRVTAEDRPDISLDISNTGRLSAPTITLQGDQVIVDGGLENAIGRCRGGNHLDVSVQGVGVVTDADAPVITARVPRAVRVWAGGAVDTTIGPAASADVRVAGCGQARIGNVAGALALSTAGSGAVEVGTSQSATVRATGSGSASLGAVAGRLHVSLSGSGDIGAESVRGPLEVQISGSGSVNVRGGSVSDAAVSIAGSGGTFDRCPGRQPDGPHRGLRPRARQVRGWNGRSAGHGIGGRTGGAVRPSRPPTSNRVPPNPHRRSGGTLRSAADPSPAATLGRMPSWR